MFASIRIYDGVTDVAKVGHGVEKLVLPVLKEQEGFVSYKLVSTGVDSIISISVFNTSEQAEAANVGPGARSAWVVAMSGHEELDDDTAAVRAMTPKLFSSWRAK
jgi:hypothetical protein